MVNKINEKSLIANNRELKNAFSQSRYLGKSEKESIFSSETKYSIGDNSSVKINVEDIGKYSGLFSGVDFSKMLEDDKIKSFEYDKNNDGNYEISLKKNKEDINLYFDNDSDGKIDETQVYTKGILRSSTKFGEDGLPCSYTTYDENGNKESLKKQAQNELGVLLTDVLIQASEDYANDLAQQVKEEREKRKKS